MALPWDALVDEYGPAKIVFVHEPRVGLEGIVVVDNVAAGPSIGGVRMAPDVTVEEVLRLARAMTWKNAAALLPHGGGKAGIVADPGMDPERKEAVVRAFAHAIRDLTEYIAGPDMGTDERAMAWVHDEIGRAVGLPEVLGGIPLDEIGATGFGLAVAAEVLDSLGVVALSGARVAIQGYGAVGRHAARFLAQRGAVIVGVSDIGGATSAGAGLELDALDAWKASGRSVGGFPGGTPLPRDELVGLECDVWIPAARPDVVTMANVDALRTRVVLCGANIPIARDAELALHERGVLVVPDFVANAGGVICASVEYHGGTRTQAFETIDEKIRANVAEVLERAKAEGTSPREAAEAMARERVTEAIGYSEP